MLQGIETDELHASLASNSSAFNADDALDSRYKQNKPITTQIS